MKYILEIEVAESEKSFVEKFFKNIPFVKKVKAVVSKEIKPVPNLEGVEVVELNKSKLSIADFSGVLSESDYQALKQHTEQARKEWNRAI